VQQFGGRTNFFSNYKGAFDPAVLAAMKTLETTLDTLKQSAAIVQQAN
jgi:hypothetical protein